MELLSKAKTGKVERPVKVLQFGEGNFLRAFVDYMIDIARERDLMRYRTCKTDRVWNTGSFP